jgi:folylpolyglutamate synthase/dihydropteroate synthase
MAGVSAIPVGIVSRIAIRESLEELGERLRQVEQPILKERSRDSLYLVPVTDHSTAAPADLAVLAKNICPDLAQCHTFSDVVEALEAATHQATHQDLVVLCGSLYLLGHFFKTGNPI